MHLLIYIGKRLLLLIPTLIGISFISFSLVRLLPGNPVYFIVGPYASPAEIERVKSELGLDEPIYKQYIIYMKDVMHGDLGYAWRTSQPVAVDIKQRLPLTFELATLSLILTLVVAVPLGVVSAVRSGSWIDNIARVIAVLGISMPIFWMGLVLSYIFFFKLHLAPSPTGILSFMIKPPPRVTGMILVDSILAGNWAAFKDAGSHMMLPVITLALPMIGSVTRMTRSSMLEVLHSDYVRTAIAFGLPQRTVIFRDALQNALLPVITVIGVLYGFSLGGAVLVEIIFSITGMGNYSFGSIMNMDYAGVQGVILVIAVIFVLINLIVDLLYAMVDPRIAYN